MTTDNPRQRPFKVWNADRSTRKGVIACNLADLIRKGKVKLDIQEGESVAVVLEADGTEVDDDYFKRLEENTVFLLLKLGERWYPPGVEAIRAVPPVHVFRNVGGCVPSTDSPDALTPSGSATDQVNRLLDSLNQNLGNIFLLSVQELQVLADLNLSEYSTDETDGDRQDFLVRLQETSSRILCERNEAKEAMEMLQLLQHHHSALATNLPHKKPRRPDTGQGDT